MEKLPMCRICLVENVRMYVVVNKSLHALYKKLTDIPFVTEDRRPVLACFFCYTKLKQCCRLLRQCLQAEELFAQMRSNNYQPNLLLNRDHLEFYSGLIKSPVQHTSIVGECQTESIAIKEELPAVCEGLYDIIEPKEEHQSDAGPTGGSSREVADIPPAPHHAESDLEDDAPIKEFKEVSKKKLRARKAKQLEPESLDNSCPEVADIAPVPHCSESDLEDDVPLMELRTEVGKEVSKMKRRARKAKRATVAKKPKLGEEITTDQTNKENADSNVIRPTQKHTSKPGTYYKEPYKCDQRSFNQKTPLTNHFRIHTGERPYKCDICERSFSYFSQLKIHILIHTSEKPYKCDVCHRSFNQKIGLISHNRIHSGEKPVKCDECQRSFRLKAHLTDHIRIHTGENPYKCDVCQRSFNHKTNLTNHIRIHTGEKPYKCDICKCSFSRNNQLTNHIRIHTGEKPYKCEVCQRTFRLKNNLTNHIRIHTGEKPHKCDVCQCSFSQNKELTNHVRRHTGEKPYKCDVCQCSFIQKRSLTIHIHKHTGEIPYKCDICERSFSEKGGLTRHIRIHTGEKPYKCDVCQRSFNQKSYLKNHIIRIHTSE